ncbi:MAG: PatB family C-S lyase [Lentimicrobium sp.]|jgi:cystathionine beta-lyase|nr:PatB family C-S lyase [Lentimicrobium sp.]
MQYNFDEIIPREDTRSVKYDLRTEIFGKSDVLPLWVADMDFRTPDVVIEAIKRRVDHEILGYSFRDDAYNAALINWLKRRHQWSIQKEWIAFAPGIVPAFNMAVMAFTQPGEGIVVQPPVYFPFFGAVKDHERKLILNPLIRQNGNYLMDYDHLEQCCREGARMLILCNPHNPVGRAWAPEELRRIGEICLKYNVLMISDEIHADLVNRGHKHTVLASLSPEIAARTITMVAASKTFNLAGLGTASVIASDPDLLEGYTKMLNAVHVGMGNIFGNVATEAAYNKGEPWLEQLLDYIDGNIRLLMSYHQRLQPWVSFEAPEATYMAWLNFSKLGLDDESLNKFIISEAGLGLNAGIQFGAGGEGFMRINLACPRATLRKALDQLEKALFKNF